MSEKRPQIVLGLYNSESPPAAAIHNALSLQLALVEHNMYGGFVQRQSCRVDGNRNYLIDYFLKDTKGDFLFIIDEDMTHPPLAPIVLARRNLPIVCGLYFKRDYLGNHATQFYQDVGPGTETRRGYPIGENYEHTYHPLLSPISIFLEKYNAPDTNEPQIFCNPDGSYPLKDGLIEIDASGFGCVLLRRDALEKMSPPYLLDERGLNGDLVFYRNAKKLGIPVYGDMSVICSHNQMVPVGISSFAQFLWKLSANVPT